MGDPSLALSMTKFFPSLSGRGEWLGRFVSDERVAEIVGASGERADDAGGVGALVGVLAKIDELGAGGEQRVDEARELVGSGGDRLGHAEVGGLAAEERAQGTPGPVQGLGRDTERGGG